ncbi:hypothetical protein ACFXPX_38460 [Kitasatospora sp. NPDC059146]|uniref:hypothetical protein n=1 Tax=unclassified Kitasatospora TaxID=2633591 RepID=UPI00367CA53E
MSKNKRPIDSPGCTCDGCRRGDSVPLDSASRDELIDLLTGKLGYSNRRTLRVRFEVEIEPGGTLRDSTPVGVKVLVLNEEHEPQPLPWDVLEPADLPRLITSLPTE